MNKVCLAGRLGADPELRTTAKGTSVCELSVATSDRRKDGDEWVDETEWHKVVVWGRKAEFVAEDLRKGAFVSVQGKLKTEKWKDKEGVDRYTTKVHADMDGGVEYAKPPKDGAADRGRRDDDDRGRGRNDRDDRGSKSREDDRSTSSRDDDRSRKRDDGRAKREPAPDDDIPF